MPPNMNTNQPFVNDVLQSVVYPKNNLHKINQAGASIYYPQNSDLRGIPFWSPNAGADPFGENISSPDAAIDVAYRQKRYKTNTGNTNTGNTIAPHGSNRNNATNVKWARGTKEGNMGSETSK